MLHAEVSYQRSVTVVIQYIQLNYLHAKSEHSFPREELKCWFAIQ